VILSSQNIFSYDEAIKLDNQPRSNFTFFWHSPSPFSQWHPAIFTVKDILFTSAEQFMMYCKAKLFKDEHVAQKIINLNNQEDNILAKYAKGILSREDILQNEAIKKEWDKEQKKIKQFGRNVQNYKEKTWVKHRIKYVSVGNYAKFSQNEDLKQVLLNTGDTILAESNPYDKIWAIGIYENNRDAVSPSKWKGINLLGKILTDLRGKFRLQAHY
jgi:ribA/ribD-fused uncharacterized protein